MRIFCRQWIYALTLTVFVLTNAVPVSVAQVIAFLPEPGRMVALSPAFDPPVLKGVKVYSKEPLRLDFILDPGQNKSGPADGMQSEANRLIKYFLAALTIPEKDLWVNLSPYERERIIPESFGKTEMGRDLLAQDYTLKQIAASLLYPEGEAGKLFWKKVYALAQEKYGTTDIPVDTFNKVWIVPDKAQVYENAKVGAAYITGSRLKVMLEQDYLAAQENGIRTSTEANGAQDIAKSVLREIIIPALEKEVNEGENFAILRQVYQSLILATWYKKKIQRSLFAKAYVGREKIAGINIKDTHAAEKIWQRYVEAFRKGAYNLIREEKDVYSDEVIPRKYFSGGMTFDWSQAGTQLEESIVPPNQEGPLVLIYSEMERSHTNATNPESPFPGLRLSPSQRNLWKRYYIQNPQREFPWFEHGWPGSRGNWDQDEWVIFVARRDRENREEFARAAKSVSDEVASSRYGYYEQFLLWKNALSHRPSDRDSAVYLIWGISRNNPDKIRVGYLNESDKTTFFRFRSRDGAYASGHGLDRPEVPLARHSLARIYRDGARWEDGNKDLPWGVISTMEWERSGVFGRASKRIDALFTSPGIRDALTFLSVMSVLGLAAIDVGGLLLYDNLPASMKPDSIWPMVALDYLPLWVKLSLGTVSSYPVFRVLWDRLHRHRQDYDAAENPESDAVQGLKTLLEEWRIYSMLDFERRNQDAEAKRVALEVLDVVRTAVIDIFPKSNKGFIERIQRLEVIVSEGIPTFGSILMRGDFRYKPPVLLLNAQVVQILTRTQLAFVIGHELGHLLFEYINDVLERDDIDRIYQDLLLSEIENLADAVGVIAVVALGEDADAVELLGVFAKLFESRALVENNRVRWNWGSGDRGFDPHMKQPEREQRLARMEKAFRERNFFDNENRYLKLTFDNVFSDSEKDRLQGLLEEAIIRRQRADIRQGKPEEFKNVEQHTNATGGIDLTTGRVDPGIVISDGEIVFYVDSALFVSLDRAEGLAPVIRSIQPNLDLNYFFGSAPLSPSVVLPLSPDWAKRAELH